MMNDDDLEMLRGEASRLRYEPGEIALARVQAGVRARLAARETVPGILIGWFRPVAAGLMAALVIAVTVATILSTEPADALLAGSDTAFANEDYYHDAR
jgi:hypothetical protein